MTTSFAEQWGPALQKAGYTRIMNALYRGDKWRRLLSFREKLLIECIISYQDDPRIGTVPSAKQLAYDSGVSYNQTRNLLKKLTNPVIDESGATVRSMLLIPIICKQGRIRYSMTPLKYELERLEKFPVLVVKPKPAPRPEPVPIPEPEPLPAAEVVEDESLARDAWNHIRAAMAPHRTAGEQHWLMGANGLGFRGDVLVVGSNDRNTIRQLSRPSWVIEAERYLHQQWPEYSIEYRHIDRRRGGRIVGLAVAALSFGGV